MKLREQIRLINQALSGTMDLYRLWAKKNNINYNALLVIYTMNECGVCTQKQISEWWALPKQTVHGILQDFEKQGYITISKNQENQRERLIAFTESGSVYADSILVKLHDMEERAMSELGENRRQQLIDANTEYYNLLRKEIEHG